MPEQPPSERRAQTRALKQGMMQELLTGKTRLVSRGDADNTVYTVRFARSKYSRSFTMFSSFRNFA